MDGRASQDARQGLLRATAWQTKRQDALRAVADEGPMARALLVVALPGVRIGLLALVGEAVLLMARMDEEAHQAAARPV